jgi:hypothetical protein
MIKLTPQQEKKALIFLLAILVALILYRMVMDEKPRTAPLAFPPGSVARSSVRQSSIDAPSGADPLSVLFAHHVERYPGVSRDIFKMENPAPKPKPSPVIIEPPPPPQRTPEEIAADVSRADLAKFRFLGYLTAKDNTLFLSKDGELFIVKNGEKFHKNYQVKRANNDSVVVLDTITGVEVRLDLSGGEPQQLPQQPAQRAAQQLPQQATPRAAVQQSTQQLSEEPAQQQPDDQQSPTPTRQLRRRVQKQAQ